MTSDELARPTAVPVRGATAESGAVSDGHAKFRPDIEGLRALAVGLVVLFHAGLPFLPGGFVGVDVFFVISGFLITGLLVDEAARTGRISIPAFYARRARRLLPLSSLVIVLTILASLAILPSIDMAAVGQAGVASSLFVANWFFAASAGDYLAGDINGNPLLHYWSLGVEEQFYVIWPLLIMLAVWGGPRAARTPSVVMRRTAVLLAVLGGLSLLLSVVQTKSDASLAYFGTQTRAWELAAGAGLALARPALARFPGGRAPGVVGALGLVLVVGSAVVLNESSSFPGLVAVVPVGGTVMLLAVGARGGHSLVGRLFASAPARYIGRVSYSWYLWHWPVLVLAAALLVPQSPRGIRDLSLPAAVLALALSFGLAAASSRFVEAPIRDSARLRKSVRWSLVMGVALVVLGVAVSLPSARSGVEKGTVSVADAPDTARADVAVLSADCHVSVDGPAPPAPATCLTGDPVGTRTVVLLGDSHAEQWYPALDRAAKQQGWKLYSWTKSRCPVIDVATWEPVSKAPNRSCTDWNAGVLERLSTVEHIDLVITGRYFVYTQTVLNDDGTRASEADAANLWRAGAARTFASMARVADRVVVLRDTPYAGYDVPACLAASSPAECAFPRTEGIGRDGALYEAERAAATDAVSFLDMNDLICRPTTCEVVGADKVIRYRDTNHLTASFSRQLAEPLGARLAALMGAGASASQQP